MAKPRVLVVAGTHGNEINGPWLLEQWTSNPSLIDSCGCQVETIIGNPGARADGRRYRDRDLNRSFRPDLLERVREDPDQADQEMRRAHELVEAFGPHGQTPCDCVIDLHSTTAAMGNCMVVYGRRPADLALAALVQAHLGLPVYLHEADAAQQGFLVERWPFGLVLEVGPVPQNVRRHDIVDQTRRGLQACLEALAAVIDGSARYPEQLVVHRHLGSIDLPRGNDGGASALIHPQFQNSDWVPLRRGDPLFITADNTIVPFDGPQGAVPVFINEAAYAEKAIAFSLTCRECWPLSPDWDKGLRSLLSMD